MKIQTEAQKDLAAQVNSTYCCPKCSKLRLIRPKGYVVSDEIVEFEPIQGLKVSLHKDACDYCIVKVIKSLRPSDKQLVNLLQHDIPGDKSLEECL